MKKARYNSRVGKLLFVLPAIVIIVVVAYAFVSLNTPGTLILQALDNGAQIQVPVTVNGHTYTTPTTLSLGEGSYLANFGTIRYYYPPTSSDVTVSPGRTSYATGVYVPQAVFVDVTQAGFNVTTITTLHGVTPVTWTNPSNAVVEFSGGPFSLESLNPGQSFTYVFTTSTSFQLTISSSNRILDVQVT